MTSLEVEVIAQKKKYSNLNGLIADNRIIEHVSKYKDDDPERLTLGIALLRMPDVIQSLEENLSIFIPDLTTEQRQALAGNLLNNRDQFLNTLSELALARHYHENSWKVRLAEPIPHSGGKDADIYLMKSTAVVRWIDVLNSAIKEVVEGFGAIMPSDSDIEKRLVDKIVGKFRYKFGPALKARWKETPWVALDFTKNDAVAVSMTLHDLIGDKKLDSFSQAVLDSCPEMGGVIYFTYYATKTSPHWIQESARCSRTLG